MREEKRGKGNGIERKEIKGRRGKMEGREWIEKKEKE